MEEPFNFNERDHTEEQAWTLYSIRKTIMQMLKDRGYNLPVGDDDQVTFEQFKERFNGKTHKDSTILAEKVDDFEQKMLVFFPSPPPEAKTPRVGAEAVKQIHEIMNQQSSRRSIVVVEKPLMGHGNLLLATETEAQHMKGNKDWKVEVFLQGELVVNITRHELVPTHKVLTEEEKKVLLRRYHLAEKHLPRIQKSDPIARYYGLEHRQVLKIIRPSETAGYYVTYRLVA